METNILFPLLLTLFAGLSTGIGSAIALLAHRTNKKFLSFSLGFSAGVMIYVSFVEMLAESKTALTTTYGTTLGAFITVCCFFGGMLLIGLIDRLVPSFENPHEVRSVEDMDKPNSSHLMRMGILTALAIAIHNFPEGIATFMGSVGNTTLGIAIAVAIAIHNIPEGIAVSVPIYYATGNKKKAFWWSFCSGFAEPLGGILAYLVLMPFLSSTLMGATFAIVAGIMVFISFDEMLPAAREYGEHHISIYGLISGMIVMAISLVLLG
ncbi:MAG: zinc transporter ZupT [Sphingobacteriia bacterium]|jgi:zinc transporter, ZIP family|nr:zinc transporter ZupT [Paludibacteraceae bacterium]NCA80060.1 zinc transporter ZupT [Sphingobacteriia bacterium]